MTISHSRPLIMVRSRTHDQVQLAGDRAVFFAQVIRDNLDAGRPDQVSPVCGRRVQHRLRRSTPGSFRTGVTIDGGSPSLHLYDTHTNIKQNRQDGRAPGHRVTGSRRP